jgi:anti-sigma factor RsiW
MATLNDLILSAFVDGELDAVTLGEVREAIEGDPVAQRKVRQLKETTSLIRAVYAQPRYRTASARQADVFGRAARSAKWRAAMMIAASLALLVGLGGGITAQRYWLAPQGTFNERLLEEVADYHVQYAKETEHQVEVGYDRVAEIEQWLGGRLSRPLHVPDLSHEGLNFAGGRLLVVDGNPVAQLTYHRGGHPDEPLAICIAYGPPEESRPSFSSRSGLGELIWRHEGYTYILVGWEDRAALETLAKAVRPLLSTSN